MFFNCIYQKLTSCMKRGFTGYNNLAVIIYNFQIATNWEHPCNKKMATAFYILLKNTSVSSLRTTEIEPKHVANC